MSWSKNILEYYFGMGTDIALPDDIEWIYPFDEDETRRCTEVFYEKYYADHHGRTLLLGINPGRFGAGVTGVPFTDPHKLEEECNIPNNFDKRKELSSNFVYEFINALGGPKAFFARFYITSICPLGFLKDGKNYNYYDSAELQQAVLPLIVENIAKQLEFGANPEVAFSIGKGKNFAFLKKLNAEHGFFERVVALPHPRWVMQYRLKSKDTHIQTYVQHLSPLLST